MKAERYAVSVQWGEGFHYFLLYRKTQMQAVSAAIALQESLSFQRKGKRGAKPKVHVWSKVAI